MLCIQSSLCAAAEGGVEVATLRLSIPVGEGDTPLRHNRHEIWVSDQVPGGMVKHTRVTKQDGKVFADTTITVKAYKVEE